LGLSGRDPAPPEGRFGIAAFAGVGGVARSFGDLGNNKVLPAAGIGVRWQASKTTPINLRIDYAAGKDSQALHISAGEAF
jgi:outer membrane translocation and assembly module TamA